MDGNGMDTEAGCIDVVSCGIGFPKDAETLGRTWCMVLGRCWPRAL